MSTTPTQDFAKQAAAAASHAKIAQSGVIMNAALLAAMTTQGDIKSGIIAVFCAALAVYCTKLASDKAEKATRLTIQAINAKPQGPA